MAAVAAMVVFTASAGFIGGRAYRPTLMTGTGGALPAPVVSVGRETPPMSPSPGSLKEDVSAGKTPTIAVHSRTPIHPVNASRKAAEKTIRTASERRLPKADCGSADAPDWCLRDAMLAADDRLRTEYEAAADAGVPRSILVAVRRDWSWLRRTAGNDPQGMIQGYRALTAELRREQE